MLSLLISAVKYSTNRRFALGPAASMRSGTTAACVTDSCPSVVMMFFSVMMGTVEECSHFIGHKGSYAMVFGSGGAICRKMDTAPEDGKSCNSPLPVIDERVKDWIINESVASCPIRPTMSLPTVAWDLTAPFPIKRCDSAGFLFTRNVSHTFSNVRF